MKNKKILKIWLVSGIATSLLGCNNYKMQEAESIKEETPIVEYDSSKMNNGTKDILFEVAEENDNLKEADIISIKKMAPWIEDNPYFDYEYAKEILKTLNVKRNQDQLSDINAVGTYNRYDNLISYVSKADDSTEFHELVHALTPGTSRGMKEAMAGIMEYEYKANTSYPELVQMLRMMIELVGIDPILQSESSGDSIYLMQALTEKIGSEKLANIVYDNMTDICRGKEIYWRVMGNLTLDEFDKNWISFNLPNIDTNNKEELTTNLKEKYTAKMKESKAIMYYTYVINHSEEPRKNHIAMELLNVKSSNNMTTFKHYFNHDNLYIIDPIEFQTYPIFAHYDLEQPYKNMIKYDATTRIMLNHLEQLSEGEWKNEYSNSLISPTRKIDEMLNIIYGMEAYPQYPSVDFEVDGIATLKVVLEFICGNQALQTPLRGCNISVLFPLAEQLGSMEQANLLIQEIERIQYYAEMRYLDNQKIPFSIAEQQKYQEIFPNIKFSNNELVYNEELENEIITRNRYLLNSLFLYYEQNYYGKNSNNDIAMLHYMMAGNTMDFLNIGEEIVLNKKERLSDGSIRKIIEASSSFQRTDIEVPRYFSLSQQSMAPLEKYYVEIKNIDIQELRTIIIENAEEGYYHMQSLGYPNYGLEIDTKRK